MISIGEYLIALQERILSKSLLLNSEFQKARFLTYGKEHRNIATFTTLRCCVLLLHNTKGLSL